MRRPELRGAGWQALLALLLVIGIGCVFPAAGAFFHWSTHRDMLRYIAVTGILACGMTVVIVTAGIDLSVGSVLALSAVTFAKVSMPWQMSPVLAILAGLGVGLLAGVVSGALVARFRIQPFIVTLAMMVFARGLAKALSGGRKVTNTFEDASGALVTVKQPPVFGAIDQTVLDGNVAIVTLVFLACVAVTWLVLARLRLGRHLYAVGGNLEAARLSGVPVNRTLVLAYALSGLFAGIAGICQAAQATHGDPETGAGYELEAIAMVVVGGTSLMGGRGGVGLTLLGALTIGTLQKVLSLNGYSTDTRLMLTGVVLVCAVLFQRARS